MHNSNITKPLLWLVMCFVVMSLACRGSAASPQLPAMANQSQVEVTTTPEGKPSNVSEVATSEATLPTTESSESRSVSEGIVIGYIDSSPAIFIQPESALIVEISKATYNPETGGLGSYQVKVKYPAGNSIDLEFYDIAFNPATGSVDTYQVAMDGNDIQGPTIEEFESRKSELGSVVAFSVNSFAGTEPLPMVSVPCQGDSNVEYGETEGWPQIIRHVITCGDQIYILEYSGYVYDNQMGTLAGYSVHVEITQ